MATIVNEALAGITVTYNDVQFGGSDSNHKSVPPQYSFRGQFVYDDAGIAVKGTRYTLNVSTIFYNTTEGLLANVVQDVRRKLSQPGKTLKIVGLGTAFGTINYDEEWGPKPLFFDWVALGQFAWQCTWEVEFMIKECTNSHHSKYAYTAFNFDTTWMNDFEGICERTISGHVEIAARRVNTNSNTPYAIADEVRGNLNIQCPTGFRRIRNVWRENAKKNRLDFVITDAVQPGTSYPTGCTQASGSLSYSSQGPGFAQALVTMDMSLKVSPAFPPHLAGTIFLTAATTKQKQIQAAQQDNKAVVVPMAMNIMSGKYDAARETHASMTWMLTKCVGSMLNASGLWEPLTPNNYREWRGSIENLWNNRGAALPNGGRIANDPKEYVIIDYCVGEEYLNFGQSNLRERALPEAPKYGFTCPTIPPDGGWLYHDLRIRVLREDNQSWHRKAVPYNPVPGHLTSFIQSPGEEAVKLGGYPYEQGNEEKKNDVEYNGLPVVYVLLQFRAIRVINKPFLPEIKQIAGQPVTQVASDGETPRIMFDAINCPVWSMSGYRVYRVNGYVPTAKPTESESSCAAPSGSEVNY